MTEARHMARAIDLAGRARTHPNPRVGAVIVEQRNVTLGERFLPVSRLNDLLIGDPNAPAPMRAAMPLNPA